LNHTKTGWGAQPDPQDKQGHVGVMNCGETDEFAVLVD